MIQKNRNLLIIGPYPPPFAGPELAIKNLLESPIKNKFCVSHLSTNARKSNAQKGRLDIQLVAAFFLFFTSLVWRLFRFNPDIVYYFVTPTRMGWLGRDVWCIALARLFGARVITHQRAGHFRHRLASASWFEVALIRWACHRVSWSLVQAPSLKDQFEGLAPSERIKVVPNMIDVKRYSAVPAESYEPGRILFLGHITVAKGYCELLKSIPQVAKNFPHVCFEFAGTKKAKERNVFHVQTTGQLLPAEDPEVVYREFVEGRFEKNYKYLGVLNEEQKIAALKRCDFLVLPSFSEGFSMAILEAMAMGKPVVCTKVGAMRDFLQNGVNGEVIEPGDTDGLIAAIQNLLSNQEYRKTVAIENAHFTRENFSQDIVAQQLAELFYSA